VRGQRVATQRFAPQVSLDNDALDVLFPRRRTWVKFQWKEFRSAVGKEGAAAAGVYLFCLGLLAYGAFLAIRTWDRGSREIHIAPVIANGPVMNLAVFWFTFALAIGIAGWLLSGKVTKRWLRIFVGLRTSADRAVVGEVAVSPSNEFDGDHDGHGEAESGVAVPVSSVGVSSELAVVGEP
jgi:hypothetical protein